MLSTQTDGIRDAITLVTPGPVCFDVEEVKDHLRVTWTEEDSLIRSITEAATSFIENYTSRALSESTWRYYLESFPTASDIQIPLGTLRSVTSIKYRSGGVQTTWGASAYHVDIYSDPGRVVLNHGYSWPSERLDAGQSVEIQFVAGWDKTTATTTVKGQIPSPIRQAAMLLAGHWYRHREAVTVGTTSSAIKSEKLGLAIDSLLSRYRLRWIG